jgi:Chalcone isomerase-like
MAHGAEVFSLTAIWRTLILATAIVFVCFAARPAELDGVQLPDTLQVDGTTFHLNGYGLRTYSILGIHIYFASLYLEHISTNPEEIIQSPETKALLVRFERSVTADQARKAWHEGLLNNCKSPCQLDPMDIEKFLANIPAVHAGDNFSLLFNHHSATATIGGQQIGSISSRQFADAMLATFLGLNPASPRLKQELLGRRG